MKLLSQTPVPNLCNIPYVSGKPTSAFVFQKSYASFWSSHKQTNQTKANQNTSIRHQNPNKPPCKQQHSNCNAGRASEGPEPGSLCCSSPWHSLREIKIKKRTATGTWITRKQRQRESKTGINSKLRGYLRASCSHRNIALGVLAHLAWCGLGFLRFFEVSEVSVGARGQGEGTWTSGFGTRKAQKCYWPEEIQTARLVKAAGSWLINTIFKHNKPK